MEYESFHDNDLVKLVKDEANNDAFLELKKRHTPLCLSVFHKYYNAICSSNKNFEDLIRDQDYIMWRACNSFDPCKKVKFSTWVCSQMTYACLNYISKNLNNNISIEDESVAPIINNLSGQASPNHELQQYCMHILSEFSDQRIKDIYQMRYFDEHNLSWSQIANQLQVSSQTVINLHEKGKDFLKKKLTSHVVLDTI